MALTVGSRLGHYDVTALIGEGGMGQVYQATDTKLNRQVALKILPEAFATDPDRLARFQREAQVLASLNHPNIAAIHGLEESDGTRALVLELVEGPTLADRIAQGPIAVDEALPIAKQITEALEAAHEAGVIHRDLKPANIKVREDGTVKVLDFGLAKALDTNPQGDPSQSPTLTAAATQMGVIMGTAAYMSPEQARGKTVDKRADIGSFGAVLFEMLTGQRAFQGEDVSVTLADVIRTDLSWEKLPSDLPPGLATYLRRCLEKEPNQRIRDIGDLRLAMEGAFETTVSAPSEPTAAPRIQLWQRPVPLMLIGLVLLAIGGLAVWGLVRPAAAPGGTVTRFPFTPPEGDVMQNAFGMALSPDGRTLVYAGRREGVLQLFVRTRDQTTVRPLPGTEGARHPFFSPDGAWVGFFTNDALKKVARAGGPPVTLCATGRLGGATWGPDDTIVFSSEAAGLMQVSAAGGEPRPLTEPPEGAEHLWPTFVPGGEAVLYTIRQSGDINRFEVAVVSLDTGARQTLVRGTDGAVTASGHLVFGLEGSLWAVPFDPDALTVSGEPIPIVEGVQVNSGGWAQYALADDGTLVYRPGSAQLRRSLVWVDRDGAQEPINVPPRAYTYARLSPDGRRIALDSRDDENDIWTWDVERETLQRLTRDPGMNRGPVWSPDGERIAFTAVRDGTESIHWQSADGSGTPEPLSTELGFPFGFTPDGSRLLFSPSLGRILDVGILDVDGSGPAELLLDQSFEESNAQVSPDGRWLAYESNESGQEEIYVRPFPDIDSALHPVSTSGGSRPLWSSEGDELFYYVDPGTIMTVLVTSDAGLVLGRPEVAVQGAFASPVNTGTHHDVSPDGRRFLLIVDEEVPEGEATPPPIMVVLNWNQELLEQVPVP